MNRNLWMFVLSAVLALGLGGCVNRAAQQKGKQTEELVRNPVRVVSTQPVMSRSLSETLEITGELTTAQDTQVSPKLPGRLIAVYVRDGDPVSAGQLIAGQDTSTLQPQLSAALAGVQSARSQLSQALANASAGPARTSAQVAQAQAQVRSARAALAKARAGARSEERVQADWQVRAAKSNLDTAEREFERVQTLVAQGAAAKQRLDQAQNAYNAALTQYNAALQNQAMIASGTRVEDIDVATEAVRQAEENLKAAQAQKRLDSLYTDQISSARAAVQSAEAQVAIVRQQIADSQIRAPFSGRIAGKPMQVGTIATPGQPVARIVGSQGIYLEGEVPESQIARIQLGQVATVSVSALGGQTFAGKVSAVNPLGQQVGRLFKVRITFADGGGRLQPGMFARAVINLRTIPDAVVVPQNAVVKRSGQDVVYVAEGEKAKQVQVTLGLRQGELVQVFGLLPGQPLVIRGQEGLVEGSAIQVQPMASAATTSDMLGS